MHVDDERKIPRPPLKNRPFFDDVVFQRAHNMWCLRAVESHTLWGFRPRHARSYVISSFIEGDHAILDAGTRPAERKEKSFP